MLQDLHKLFDRDLGRLHSEIEAFTIEAHLWARTGSIANPAGNLCLHLVGNLNTYIGKELGNTGYVRNREAEFSTASVSREELLRQVAQTRETVAAAIQKLTEDDLKLTYPLQVLGFDMTTGYFLVHLLGHLNYHLGQINYLRRMQD